MTDRHPASPWNAELDAALIAAWHQRPSLTARQIGTLIGVNKNQVIGRAHRLKLPKRASPIKRRDVTMDTPPEPVQPKPKPLPRLDDNSGHYSGDKSITCRWLEGEPRDESYCTESRLPGKAWCSTHFVRVYQPIPKRPGGIPGWMR